MRTGTELCVSLELVLFEGQAETAGVLFREYLRREEGVLEYMFNGPSEEQYCAAARLILELSNGGVLN
jgi:hypothetical protein